MQSITKRRELSTFRYLSLAAVLAVFVLNILGGMMRVTQSSGACPDWPTCLGQWGLPSAGDGMLVTYLHRVAAVMAGVIILAGCWLAARRHPADRLLAYPYYAALAASGVQILVGGAVTMTGASASQPWLGALHLGLSLLIQAALVVPLVVSYFRLAGIESTRLSFRAPFVRLSLVFAAALFTLWLTGSLVTYMPAAQNCPGWPLCVPQNSEAWFNFTHRVLVGVTGLIAILWLGRAWQTQRSHAPLLVTTTATAVLFFSQALLGSALGAQPPSYLLVLHQATAIAVWVSTAAQLVIAVTAGRSRAEEQIDLQSARERQIPVLLKDFLMLTKPIVVLLLLVTTYAGMVIGARHWPSPWLTFWTMLGGFLAAGGSGAINQYIDRFDDEKMQRTQKRPIPSGRMTGAEGLAFGVALLLAAFYLTVAFVNLLAALLCLAGMIYYVLIYSVFLKKTTVQNIVIGGGAGAIPPLVGWAAATGGLNIPSLFLFALVFMWTPPHFWALALVRAKDYARAGVPMLPVVRGEQETRWQILVYTIELVVLTLLFPVFGLGSSIYLVGAVVLGAWLLHSAWKVWKDGGNKLAWKMYRYSSMYLAFIFVVLMVDRLMK